MDPRVIFSIVLFLSLSFLPAGKTDLAADRAALLSLRSAVGGRSLLWNTSQTSPCSWTGVTCEAGQVVELRLPGMGLAGQVPVGSIGKLTRLRTLSLRFNALSGPLPADFASITGLRNLYLQHNSFSGPIPDFIFSFRDLVRLNLAFNSFSGEIPVSFNNLPRLATLFVENNKLNGSIPELNFNSSVQFNVSNNLLNGSIPSSLSAGRPASAFSGNFLCGAPLSSCGGDGGVTPTDESQNGKKKKKLSGGAIAGIIIGSVLGLLLIILLLLFLCRRKKNEKTREAEIETVAKREVETQTVKPIGEGGGDNSTAAAAAAAIPVSALATTNKSKSKSLIFFGEPDSKFDLEDLLKASAEVLGKGTFGTAYKAVMEMGIAVAVKRLKDATMGEKEFKEKIEFIGAMNNENLVPLRAYYFSRDEKLLVYDYMPMGSLSALLHGNKGGGRTPLNWETRSAIALGASRGITYLHSQGSTVSHGSIKSSNILLSQKYEARVSDFGLAQFGGPATAPNRVAGYRAPEVTDQRKVSQKADVYSFGVLLLELLTGKAPTHALMNEDGVDLPRWVQSVVREEWTAEVFDQELLRYHEDIEEEMVKLLQLAIDCAAQYPDKRPSIAEVTAQIEDICRSSLQRQHSGGVDSGPVAESSVANSVN
ncbi:probable inactive receptor kinase At1g48480 [Impatiens glandulifera]|uniref:probable inactive receptor kinase At1g48480 n=1 Tax=Impatiens glandulifera TaxID=253017 RepID=UPI001FB1263E|nr:probable inactive receptor kinase At1g48480 [Impatiens glandulifera]